MAARPSQLRTPSHKNAAVSDPRLGPTSTKVGGQVLLSTCPATYRQVPATHPDPDLHCVPHVPQLLPSVCRSEQVPAQSTVPAGHAQEPLLQTRFEPQTSEQRPQCALSLERSTHWAPHWVNPEAAHRTAHTPSLQIGSAPPQRVPQAPQLSSFDDRFTQFPRPAFLPAHWVVPGGQAQVPPMQGAPPGQATPQAPQLRRSVSRSTQASPHRVSPAAVLHIPVHTPALQSVPGAQRWPHAPQLAVAL